MAVQPKLAELELIDVSKTFSRRGLFRSSTGTMAVCEVSLSVKQREMVALVGESGSGKSTLARIAARLIPPTSGQVLFNGAAVPDRGARHLLAYRRQVQMIFQSATGALNPRRTILESVATPLRVHDGLRGGVLRERVVELLKTVGLSPAEAFLQRYPHQMSGGQLQRVVIARALSMQPSILVADEPVSALDVSVRARILQLLEELREHQHVGCLLITHDLAVVRAVADRVLVMKKGVIVESGSVEQVFADPQHEYTAELLDASPRVPSHHVATALHALES